MQPIEIFSEESVFVMYDYQTLSTMFMLQALGKSKTLLPPDELCKEGFVINSNENQTPCAVSRVRAAVGAAVTSVIDWISANPLIGEDVATSSTGVGSSARRARNSIRPKRRRTNMLRPVPQSFAATREHATN